MTVPNTQAAADELRRQILDLPDGFLAKLYVDLYEGKSLRLEGAKVLGRHWYSGLTP